MKIADKLGWLLSSKAADYGQHAEAVQLGIARALIKFNAEFRNRLRRVDMLTRDSRMG